jgi:hypothetical protein
LDEAEVKLLGEHEEESS